MRRCLVLDLDFGAIDRAHGAARGLGAPPPRGVRRAGAVESARAEAPGGVHSWAGAAIDAPAQQHCPLRLRAGASPSRRAADQHQRAVRRDAVARPPLPCFTFLLQRGVPRSERRIGNRLS